MIKHIFNISTNETDYIYNFVQAIKKNQNEKLYIQLLDCNIPNSFYNINDSNNKIYITESHFDGSNDFDITINLTNGNYNIDDLILEIQTKLLSSTLYNLDYILSYDINTFKINISQNIPDRKVKFDFTQDNADYEILGFNEEIYYLVNSLTAPNCLNLQPQRSIFIRSSMVHNSYSKEENIFFNLPLSIGKFYYQMNTYRGEMIEIKQDLLTYIDFQLTDKDKNILDLNNLNWSMNFSIIIEKQPDKNEKLLNKGMEIEALSDNIGVKIGQELSKNIKPLYDILIKNFNKKI